MRKEILRLGGGGVETITVSPIPGSTRVTVFVKMQRDKLAAVMSGIPSFLPRGEFGRLKPV